MLIRIVRVAPLDVRRADVGGVGIAGHDPLFSRPDHVRAVAAGGRARVLRVSLADRKIVLDDPIETPDLTQELAALMPAPVS